MNSSERLIKNSFKLDKADMIIISSLQDDPEATHMDIAKLVNKSQPAVGMRIKRLKEMGLLKKIYGINFRNVDLALAYVAIQTSDAHQLIEKINNNIGKLLVWSTSGEYNLKMLVCGDSIKDIEKMVSKLSKNEECIKLIKIEVIDNLLTEFILPLEM